MTNEDLVALLEKYDYIVDCYSPLEISNENGDRATGEFAQLVIDLCQSNEPESN